MKAAIRVRYWDITAARQKPSFCAALLPIKTSHFVSYLIFSSPSRLTLLPITSCIEITNPRITSTATETRKQKA